MDANDKLSLIEQLRNTLQQKGKSVPEFEEETGIPKDRVYKWLKRGTERIGHEDANTIKRWIEGNLDNSPKNYLETRRNHKLNHVKEDDITVYQIGTKASFIDIYDDEQDQPIGKLNSSVFPGCNHAEKVSGSSMYPMIFNQAMVVGEKLNDAKGISSGEIHVIHTKRGLRTCKYVHTIEKKPDEIKLVALNKNVPSQVIPVEDIILIMRVYFIINPS